MVAGAMIGSVCTVILLASTAAPGFEGLASEARTVNNLGRYLEEMIGDCDHDTPGFDEKACRAEVAKVQRSRKGTLLRVLRDDVRDQITFAGWDDRKKAFRLHLTPLFPERDVAMSIGKPTRFTADGLPVLKNIPIWVSLPKGEAEFAFRRRLERGMVRLELLVRPKAPWQKTRKGEDPVRGLDVELVALRVYPARGSTPLAEQVVGR